MVIDSCHMTGLGYKKKKFDHYKLLKESGKLFL